MRSSIYLTLLPIFFASTFAGTTPPGSPHDNPQNSVLGSGSPQDNPQDQELKPISLGVGTERAPPGSPPPGSPPRSQQGSPQRQTSPQFRSGNLPTYFQGSNGGWPGTQEPRLSDMVMHGFKCQKTLYEQIDILATVERACKMYYSKKKTVGVTRYPMISKDPEDEKNFKIVFPLPSGKYFGWGAPGNHFVRIDPRCTSAEVVYQVRQKPQQASKHWCRLPNCFARGGKIYNSCTQLWERAHKGPEYFNVPPHVST